MRAFVTGATGLLGNNLVRELISSGHEVRALVRSRAKAERVFQGLAVQLVEGDMVDVPAFAPALDGTEVVFHTAAYFREYYSGAVAEHWKILEAVNVRGTAALLEAAHAHGVRRVIDTSSGGIIGLKPDGSPGDEDTPPAPIAGPNLYFRSKVQAERAAREFSARTGLEVTSVLPGWMFGPGDAAPTSAGQLIQEFVAGKLPAIPPGGTSLVDARDVARAMVALATVPSPRPRYIVGGRFVTLAELVQTLARVTGRPAPRVRIPYAVALGIAFAAQSWARLTRSKSVMTVEGVRVLAANLDVDSALAERTLGVRFRPLEETLRDSVAWIQANASPGAPAGTRDRPVPATAG
jgi:dihydroflavonol-4-reductase